MRIVECLPPIAAAVFAVAMTVAPKNPPPVTTGVYAHYMPWFRAEPAEGGAIIWDHWQWFGKGPKHDPDDILENGRRDIASVYYPLIGPYHGRDPAVLEYHMLTARAAGIAGFIADWYGPGGYSDLVFGDMVKAAERYGMKTAICLEEKTFFPGYAEVASRADVLNVMEKQVRHVVETHGRSPAYLRWDGALVLFIFNYWGNGALGPNQLSPEEVREVLGRFDEPIVLVRGGADPAYLEAARGSYVWCVSAPERAAFYKEAGAAFAAGNLRYWVGGVSPGFDDTGVWGWGNGPRKTDRRGTDEYRDTWNQLLEHRPSAVQVITWNDFGEGTVIEPTEEFEFTFLDLTEEFIGRFSGRPVRAGDNRWPLRIHRMRKLVEKLPEASRSEWNEALDSMAMNVAMGRRFFMGWKLRRLESRIGRAVDQLSDKTAEEPGGT